jgi:ankyrin repeat protein
MGAAVISPAEVRQAVDRRDMATLGGLTSQEANGTEPGEYTPLMNAVMAQDAAPAVVAVLIGRGADVNAAESGQRWTALHFAARDQNAALVRLLLEAGAEVDPQDAFGDTPLWRSVMSSAGRLAAMKLLVEHGADPGVPNLHGISPLDLARKTGQDDVVALLEGRDRQAG